MIFAIVAFSATVGNAQESVVDTSKTSEISFKTLDIDYGVVEQKSDGTRVFEFTNTGAIPLVLVNVAASCGCTVVEWAKQPIKPGDSGKISVKYNTNIVGPFHKAVRVFSNAKNSPVMLTIKGDVKPLPQTSGLNHK